MRTLAVNCHLKVFQSSRPLRGATVDCYAVFFPEDISILAPLAGRDLVEDVGVDLVHGISILAPLAGRDHRLRR